MLLAQHFKFNSDSEYGQNSNLKDFHIDANTKSLISFTEKYIVEFVFLV